MNAATTSTKPGAAANPSAQHQVAAAFSSIAGQFDSTLENEITRHLREKIYSVIRTYAKPGSDLLDINCGTGIDALRLQELGYRVTGIDIAPGMIAAAQAKESPTDAEKIRFVVSSYDNLASLSLGSFDVIFSNFGGLNCTSDLSVTARSISSATKPGGYFIGVLMPSFSIWEFVSFASRFRWSEAVRRFRRSAPATGFRDNAFPVSYYSPGAVARTFSAEYAVVEIIGLSILSATPQSTKFSRRYPRISRLLNTIDGKIEKIPLIRSAGDHYIIVLQKRP